MERGSGNYGNTERGRVANLSQFAADFLVFSIESTGTSSVPDKREWLVTLKRAPKSAKLSGGGGLGLLD